MKKEKKRKEKKRTCKIDINIIFYCYLLYNYIENVSR